MPTTTKPTQPVALATNAFYSRRSGEAALAAATKFFAGRSYQVTGPSEPCPAYLGRAGEHSHLMGTLDVDGHVLPSLLKIQTHEMPRGHRPWRRSGTTRVAMELSVDAWPLTDIHRVGSRVAEQGDADFDALRLMFGVVEWSPRPRSPRPRPEVEVDFP